jgi:hypothetical protein
VPQEDLQLVRRKSSNLQQMESCMTRKGLTALSYIVLFLAAADPGSLAAQARRNDAPAPFIGFALGPSSMPDALKGCGLGPRAAAEIRVGMSWGTAALEGRGAVMTSRSGGYCGVVLPEEVR